MQKENTMEESTESVHEKSSSYESVDEESSSNAMSTSSLASEESDENSDSDANEKMSEDDDSISSTFPSNVYKLQDAFDDDNDYMAYAS